MRVDNENKYSHNSKQGMVTHKAPAWHRCPASEGGAHTRTVPTIPQKCHRHVGDLRQSQAPNSRSCLALVHPMWSTVHDDAPHHQSRCRAQECPMSRAPAAEHSQKVPAQPPTHTGRQGTALQEGGPQRSWQGEVLLFIIPEQRGKSQQTFGEPLQVALGL